ncbi:sugar-proton symporter [Ameyamaea chiangmaiensis NBRC 103196]|uniref:Sugar porter family MFS transporter n=1 Tax=Ameyamaea chiangmaiensis TaxID=442969 RepID=A0A850PB02_9PROT|nr:sugar porter family MFS transporter [Ameyamaea chiangmaiensis]MBS4074159.1 sugar porter family MFS transporter [Ameyamaea chiangmaiensis]NVN39102.1 sugar porter family MFS transporter [Ameyamaea chiangmaiensis]GBQ71081.1 sugar-proton symporter [Ameyamaea chiangmaiensis NBRC 103196]
MPATRPHGMTGAGLPAVLLAVTGLLVGLDTGLISGALDPIARHFAMGLTAQEQTVSIVMIGAACASWTAGICARRLGRRRTLRLALLCALAGAALCVTAPSPLQIMAGRLIMGAAIGTFAFLTPLYVAELAPDRLRGRLISTYSLLQSAGILLGYLTGAALDPATMWRVMIGVPFLPAALLLILSKLVPESPPWLVAQGRVPDARAVLRRLRNDATMAERELTDIERAGGTTTTAGFAFLRGHPFFRRTLMLGIALQVFQQFSGVNVILYYAPRLTRQAGVADAWVPWVPVAVGVANVLVGVVAVLVVDRLGRRRLLIASFLIMAVALALSAVCAGATFAGAPWGLIAGLVLFVIGFGLGAGPVVWMLCSEIQPEEGREFGVACSTLANWIADWLISSLSSMSWRPWGSGRPWAFWPPSTWPSRSWHS